MKLFRFFKKIGHSKTLHAGNYMVLLGLRDRRDKPHMKNYNLSSFKLNKLMYYVEGLAYVRLGRGIVDDVFQRSIYSVFVPSISAEWRRYGQLDLLLHLEWRYWNEYNDNFLPHFLLSDEEKAVIQEVWEAFRGVSQWTIAESIQMEPPHQKTVEREKAEGTDSFLTFDREDIKEYFLSVELTEEPLSKQIRVY